MGWNDPDVYYQPEKFGLTVVAEIDYSDGNYVFDFRVVWKHSSGILLTARDSGCSCPSPFEEYTSLEEVELFDYDEIEREVAGELNSSYADITSMQAADFLNKIRRASKDAVKPADVEASIRRQIQAALTS